MKKQTSLARRLLASTACLLVLAPSVSHAADYYLQRNQTQGWSWHTVNSGTGWFATASGGNAITEIDPTGDYLTNGFQVRTRETKGHETDHFPGSRLVLNGANGGKGADIGTLVLKSTGDALAKVDVLVAERGEILTGSGRSVQNLHVGTLALNGSVVLAANASGRGINLSVDKLTGVGTMTCAERDVSDGTTSINLAIADTDGFTGTISLQSGLLQFDRDLRAPQATLELVAGSTINLNGKTVTVSALKADGRALSAGTYTSGDLQSRGLKASGSGKITVGAK